MCSHTKNIAPETKYRAAAVIGCGFLILLFFRDPRVEGNFPTCPWLWCTGTFCPGCGTMRAIHQVLHLDIISAINYNALTVLLLPTLMLTLLSKMRLMKNTPLGFDFSKASSRVIYTLAIIVSTFWILRNIPYEPFVWLAPMDSGL